MAPDVASVGADGDVEARSIGVAPIVATSGRASDTVLVTVRLGWRTVATGGQADHTCALSAAGTTYCWGFNQAGALGDGSTSSRVRPTPVLGNPTFSALTLGGVGTCGLTRDGVVFCWGANGSGRVGDGTFEDRLTPTLVQTPARFVSLSTSGHTCGVTTSSELVCWGDNSFAQLGVASSGTGDFRPLPLFVATAPALKMVSAGVGHTCGVSQTGTAYCWGINEGHQLGNGEVSYESDIKPVLAPGKFTVVAALYVWSCGIVEGGDAYCWGSLGALQQPTTDPTKVAGGFWFSSLAAGEGHQCGIISDGAVCWGYNFWGQLGDGTTVDRAVPVRPTGDGQFIQIAAGHFHSCALTVEHAIVCWGNNLSGQLGDGTKVTRSTPAPILDP